MTVATVSTCMTAEEFYEWVHRAENRDRRFELVEGEVIELSRPGERHGYVCMNVARMLGNYTFQRRQGYVCSNDTGLLLGRDPDTVKGPDVFLYTSKKKYRDLKVQYSEELPQLAVEVLSPNDRWGETTKRIQRFLALGIQRVWLLDPEEESVTIYRPAGQLPQVLHNGDVLTDPDLLPEFQCKVADLFTLQSDVEIDLPCVIESRQSVKHN